MTKKNIGGQCNTDSISQSDFVSYMKKINLLDVAEIKRVIRWCCSKNIVSLHFFCRKFAMNYF